MIEVTQNKENSLILITECGKISFHEKLDLVNKLIPLLDNKKEVKILHDMTKAEYYQDDIEGDNLCILSELIKEKKTFIKHAAVHESALGTAISMLYEKAGLPKNYNHKIFYTKEAALQWLSES